MPRSQSAAKHIDLVQTILQAHYLSRGAGIYQAYSGFFSGVAWLCDLDFPAESDHFVIWNSLVEPAQVQATSPAAGDAKALARNYYLDAQATGGASQQLYAIYSPASVADSVDYGLEILGQAQAWRDQMLASPYWHLVYASGGSYLFRDVITAHQVTARPARHKKAKRKIARP